MITSILIAGSFASGIACAQTGNLPLGVLAAVCGVLALMRLWRQNATSK